MGMIIDGKKQILRELANGQRNCAGDYWDVKSNVLEAIEIIEWHEKELDQLRTDNEELKKVAEDAFIERDKIGAFYDASVAGHRDTISRLEKEEGKVEELRQQLAEKESIRSCQRGR